MAHPFQSVQAPVSQAAGTGTLVAAVPGARIRVMSAFLSSAAASTFNFQSHTTTSNKTGTFTMGGDGLVLPYNPDGWFVTNAGEALDAVVGTTTLSGSINYVTL